MIVWDPEKPLGGNSEQSIKKARLVLWKGHCLVHTRFTTDHVQKMRSKFPWAKIVVHPECTEDVVASSDAVGSTSFIVDYVKNAAPGTTIIIGTEINLVERLGHEYDDKTIIPLKQSLCPNMFKISPENLLDTLENIGQKNIVEVETSIKNDAKLALDRMLTL